MEDKYIAFISGIGGSLSSNTSPLALDLVMDFLSGSLVCGNERELAKKIVRVVLAGGTLGNIEMLATTTPKSQQQARAMEPIR